MLRISVWRLAQIRHTVCSKLLGFISTQPLQLDNNLQRIYNIIMKRVDFEWNSRKAAINLNKHGVSFEEAKTVFYDDNARIIDDPEHSLDEERFIILGLSFTAKMLVVCHCYRDSDNIIRIISARRATKTETKQYRGFL